MKSLIVVSLLLLCAAIATLQFVHKVHSLTDDVDRVVYSLYELKQTLPQGTRIKLKTINTPGETGFWARYALAPIYLTEDTSGNYDTILLITKADVRDSIANGKLIWQHVDSQYRYSLSCDNEHAK